MKWINRLQNLVILICSIAAIYLTFFGNQDSTRSMSLKELKKNSYSSSRDIDVVRNLKDDIFYHLQKLKYDSQGLKFVRDSSFAFTKFFFYGAGSGFSAGIRDITIKNDKLLVLIHNNQKDSIFCLDKTGNILSKFSPPGGVIKDYDVADDGLIYYLSTSIEPSSQNNMNENSTRKPCIYVTSDKMQIISKYSLPDDCWPAEISTYNRNLLYQAGNWLLSYNFKNRQNSQFMEFPNFIDGFSSWRYPVWLSRQFSFKWIDDGLLIFAEVPVMNYFKQIYNINQRLEKGLNTIKIRLLDGSTNKLGYIRMLWI